MNKNKEVAKNDSFQRINYLIQAAYLAVKQNSGRTGLARFYALTLGSIAKKNVIKLDSSVKRMLCKKCYCLQIPGITSTVRVRHRRRHGHQVVTCLECDTVKRYPVNSEYQLWSERSEAWLTGTDRLEVLQTVAARSEAPQTSTARSEAPQTSTPRSEALQQAVTQNVNDNISAEGQAICTAVEMQ